MPRIERVLRRVARDVPGTLVERKACSVAWHYRQAEPEYGMWRARELLDTLDQLLAGIPAEVLHGHRVIEVRARGVDKGTYVRRLFPSGKVAGHLVLAAGDDVTDIDLYRELPPGLDRDPRRPRPAAGARAGAARRLRRRLAEGASRRPPLAGHDRRLRPEEPGRARSWRSGWG